MVLEVSASLLLVLFASRGQYKNIKIVIHHCCGKVNDVPRYPTNLIYINRIDKTQSHILIVMNAETAECFAVDFILNGMSYINISV